jgi:hypothetical protein
MLARLLREVADVRLAVAALAAPVDLLGGREEGCRARRGGQGEQQEADYNGCD